MTKPVKYSLWRRVVNLAKVILSSTILSFNLKTEINKPLTNCDFHGICCASLDIVLLKHRQLILSCFSQKHLRARLRVLEV